MKVIQRIRKVFAIINIGIVKFSTLEYLQKQDSKAVRLKQDLNFMRCLHTYNLQNIVANLEASNSQLRQDLFVLAMLDFKKNGFFVEFGATNGVLDSNTLLLEKNFSWTGVLCEPAKVWHNELEVNRNCIIEKLCVWKVSNSKLTFLETSYPSLSTLSGFSENDFHSKSRSNSRKYSVETISLLDLLNKHNAPNEIDYLSIDTEGSEFQILNAFDFTKYRFKVITCEHNYGNSREQIFDLLSSHGYVRVYEDLSFFDDWYVHESLLSSIKNSI